MTVEHNPYHLIPTPKNISKRNHLCASEPVTSRLTIGKLRKANSQKPQPFKVGFQTSIEIRLDDRRIHDAVRSWRASFSPTAMTQHASVVLLTVDTNRVKQKEGYVLRVTPKRIELIGGSAAGCFYGLQTLYQLSSFDTGDIRSVEISDWPDFTVRGLLHDITRGKVPTLATLKRLVDRLALLKINHLQLYIEHAFVFSFDSTICCETQGLTPDEIRELSLYCHNRFIELVPAVANLGHMGRILSLPHYRHLAEIKAPAPWEKQTWPMRARGLTLDSANPRARQLVEHILSDIFEAFDSPNINICGDEPWDLGKCKGTADVDQGEVEALYLSHIRFVHDLCERHGRRVMLWSDVVREHRHRLSELPADITLLHWGYDDQADYAGTASLVETGLPTWVCPGTSGFKRIVNAMNLAERNITTFAKVGLSNGKAGLLNTDWGDHGHFNTLSCSWHCIALGAACAWNTSQHTGQDFDEGFAHQILGLDEASGVTLLREASKIADRHETWRLMWTPCDQLISSELPDMETLMQAQQTARDAETWWLGAASSASDNTVELNEISTACSFSQLLAEKMLRSHRLCNSPDSLKPSMPAIGDWHERLRQATTQYAANWNRLNKPSGLQDILRVLESVAVDCTKHDQHGFFTRRAPVP